MSLDRRVTTLLHISDMHFSQKEEAEFRRTWDAFVQRLRRMKEDRGPIDYVCITGDLVKAADDFEAYARRPPCGNKRYIWQYISTSSWRPLCA
jgi:predicted MPP superfamily phosphohydrolase